MVKKSKKVNNEEPTEEPTKVSSINSNHLLYALLVVLAFVTLFNQYQLYNLSSMHSDLASNLQSVSYADASGVDEAPDAELDSVIPTGVPKIYGAELSIAYDDVSAANPTLADQTIAKLAAFDQSITLEGADLERYIEVAGSISCEYCCGAASIIFSNGQPACGCAHSFAMRGLAKYLIIYHADEFTDDEILEELGKWKVLFFPGIHEEKAVILAEQGIELNYINLASNLYRGIEQGSSGGSMVGGC